jgi:hypothetical protein
MVNLLILTGSPNPVLKIQQAGRLIPGFSRGKHTNVTPPLAESCGSEFIRERGLKAIEICRMYWPLRE